MNRINAIVRPLESFDMLSPSEVLMLEDRSTEGLHPIFRQCSLAVLNSGSETDDINELMSVYDDFDVKISQKHNGLCLNLINAPANAFTSDGKIIQHIRELLFAVLRDLVYTVHQYERMNGGDLTAEKTTDLIFHILRNAGVLRPQKAPNMVVVWGGHSVTEIEYEYTKELGYQLGLNKLNVTNGSGPGVMGAISVGGQKGHDKQRYDGLVCGISEPQILAAEVPNENLDSLVVMPDIEKRLEAFLRYSTVTMVCPGGVGTMEEIFSHLLCQLHPDNKDIPLPLIFTGPKELEGYFKSIDDFIGLTLGREAQNCYEIIIDDPVKASLRAKELCEKVYNHRLETGEAFHFNWSMTYPEALQEVFEPSHDNMASLKITPDMSLFDRAVNLRSLMSGIVAGNVKRPWVDYIVEKGPYQLSIDPAYSDAIESLLKDFIKSGRMKIKGEYIPSYKII